MTCVGVPAEHTETGHGDGALMHRLAAAMKMGRVADREKRV